jgi:hypothetical protein
MEWQIVIAVLIAIPVIIFPLTAISNIGRLFRGDKNKREVQDK